MPLLTLEQLRGRSISSPQRALNLPVLPSSSATSSTKDPWLGFGVQRKPEGCQKCPHRSYGLSFVPDEYPPDPRIAALLEAPGKDEALECRPLWGKSGQLWTWELIGKLGYKRSDVLIANTIRCRPPENKYPTGQVRVGAETCCRQYDRISRRDGAQINEGIATWNPNLYIVTFHPAAILRTRALMRLVRKDMEKAFSFAEQGYRPCVIMGDKALSLLAPWTRGRGGVKAWRSHFWLGEWPQVVRPADYETFDDHPDNPKLEDDDVPF